MNIGLLGHGIVGSGVTKIINDQHLNNLTVKKILVKDASEITGDNFVLEADEILLDEDIDIVVECMGGIEPAYSYVKKALLNKKHVVTSNKKMFANKASELLAIAKENNVAFKYEASCGGGIPWMCSLDRIKRIDEVNSFEGIFNGTTNYILSKMTSEAIDFSEALKQAQELGYAERDPSDDIDGNDVSSKVLLSCLKGFDVVIPQDDIITRGIRHIALADIESANSLNRTIKLIGKGKYINNKVVAYVMPTLVKSDSVLANISLNYNAIECDSTTLGKTCYIGQGAGSLPTAHAVVQDLIDITKGQDVVIEEVSPTMIDNSQYESCYYIRSTDLSSFTSIMDKQLTNEAILTKQVSLLEVEELVKQSKDEQLFIAEVPND